MMDSDDDAGKLFVGGIPWEATEEKLREYFHAFGEVSNVAIIKEKGTGRGRGFGFVAFVDPLVALRVVQLKHTIDGRPVEAKKAVPKHEQQNSTRSKNLGKTTPIGKASMKRIFVGGLAATVTEDNFRQYFHQFGNITDVVVMYDNVTQRHRGFGFITFDSEDAVERVVQKSFHELNGKTVEVKRAVPKELYSGPASRLPSGGRGVTYNGSYGQNYGPRLGNGYGGMDNRSYGQNYGARLGNGYGGMDNRYGTPQPMGRGDYPLYGPLYGPGGYPSSSYRPTGGYPMAMNGGFGATSGYPGVAGYGAVGGCGGGYGNVSGAYGTPRGTPQSPWGGGVGFVSGGSPAGGYGGSGMANYGTPTPSNSGYGPPRGGNAYGGAVGSNVTPYGAPMHVDSSWRPSSRGVSASYGFSPGPATANGTINSPSSYAVYPFPK